MKLTNKNTFKLKLKSSIYNLTILKIFKTTRIFVRNKGRIIERSVPHSSRERRKFTLKFTIILNNYF